jgi:hypothetical protein
VIFSGGIGVIDSMGERFAPTVMVDGERVTPEGWMWILGFALGGVQWALDECEKPEFDLRGKIRDYYRRKQVYEINTEIERLEKRLKKLRLELDGL